jgi:hypothetical protein
MLCIEGVWYRQCTVCRFWFPVEEIGWSGELLGWVCYEHPRLTPHLADHDALPPPPALRRPCPSGVAGGRQPPQATFLLTRLPGVSMVPSVSPSYGSGRWSLRLI